MIKRISTRRVWNMKNSSYLNIEKVLWYAESVEGENRHETSKNTSIEDVKNGFTYQVMDAYIWNHHYSRDMDHGGPDKLVPHDYSKRSPFCKETSRRRSYYRWELHLHRTDRAPNILARLRDKAIDKIVHCVT